MTTVLVTGGAGFIGSHLCDALLRAGRHVRVLDDLSSGNRANLAPGVEFTEGDIADPAAVARAIEGVDACCHLAAIASVERGMRDWPGRHRVNLTGTIVLLDALRGRPVPFVYASRAHGIPTTGLRFFNVYGPRQDPRSPYSGVISIFCDRLARGAPILIHGDGTQTRDFVYVQDVVEALLRALDRGSAAPAVFNVCSGVPTSVMDLARTAADLSGTTPELSFAPPRSGDIRHSLGSPERARAEFGLSAPTPLREGLRETLAWLGRAPR